MALVNQNRSLEDMNTNHKITCPTISHTWYLLYNCRLILYCSPIVWSSNLNNFHEKTPIQNNLSIHIEHFGFIM